MSQLPPEVRNLRFDVDAVAERHWHGGRKSVSNFFDNLSVFFPVGERFFIASVRAHQEHVTSPELAAAVRAFNGQEGVHGREHDRINDMLRARGYPIDAMEARVVRLLDVVTRVFPPRVRLGVTCALEHFTALMAHALLGDSKLLEGADPVMAALWRWHAAEENEHKAVAYDVYVAAGGWYGERIVTFVLASTIFWAKILEQQIRMMHTDGILWSLREWAALVRFTLSWVPRIAPLYLAYLRPGFHPDDIDASELLETWKRQYGADPFANAA